MSALARAIKKRNPLDYVDGKALGEYLRSNPVSRPKTEPAKSVQLAPEPASRRSQRYRKGRGRPD